MTGGRDMKVIACWVLLLDIFIQESNKPNKLTEGEDAT